MNRIDEIYAFIVADPHDDNNEGIPTFNPSPGMFAPMIGADHDRVMSLRELAISVATDMQVPVRLVRFSVREELEVIEPGPAPEKTEQPTVVEVEEPGPVRVEDDNLVGWADMQVLGEADVDIRHGGVMVFSALIEGKPTVMFQFFTGEEGEEPMKPLALQEPHGAKVGPLALVAWQAAISALQRQQN